MKKGTIIALAALLVLALSSFASASGFVGVGIGIVGLEEGGGAATTRGIIGTANVDLDLIEKLSLSANGYVEYKKAEGEQPVTINYLVGGYAKYALANLDALKLGAVAGVNYNKNFAPIVGDAALDYGAGVFAEQPLGDTGVIYAQGMYWLKAKGIGGLGGLKFKITENIAVKGQVEYVNKHTLFSIGAGYQF
ncbi:MAG: hypothetical protein VB144_14170 [Clostridia bacterium]|nr:hypothetical protein [Clostridia bacterium]